jgi:hypothetical protein
MRALVFGFDRQNKDDAETAPAWPPLERLAAQMEAKWKKQLRSRQ